MKKYRILTLLAMLVLCVCLLPSKARADTYHNMEVEVTIHWTDQSNVHQDRPERLYIVLQEGPTASAGYECTMTPANQSPSDPNVWKYTITNVTYDTTETWFAHEHFLYEWGEEEKNAFNNAYTGQYYNLTVKSSTKATCEIQYTRKDVHSFTQEEAIPPYFSTAATCTTPDLYFKTCLCGEIGTETFPYGEPDPDKHDWSEFGYTWANDNSTCTAERVCAHNAEHMQTSTVNSSAEVTQAQTCTLPELTKYTAHSFGLQGALMQTKSDVQTKPAAGHDWGDVYYISGSDGAGNRTLSAQRVCNTDYDHKEAETVIATGVVTQPQTCAQSEITTYTGTFSNAAFGTKSFDVPTTSVGDHVWGEVSYTWTADNRSCTAERVCGYDTTRNHVETETVTAAAQVTQNKTCSQPEITTYTTAAFQNELFEVQTKEVETRKAGHDWGEIDYDWADDNSSCTAQRVCKTDGSHVETETATAAANVTQTLGCETPELTTFTAVFNNKAFATQTIEVETQEAPGHDWGETTYTWSADNKTCTAERICKTDGSHVETETATADAAVTQKLGCEAPELTTFTAVFNNKAFATQTIEVETQKATGHNWGEPTYTWSADNKTCTAERVCSHDTQRDHVESETVDTRAEITQQKTESLPELTTYTALFGSPVFEKQTKANVKTADPIQPPSAPEAPAEVPSTGDKGIPFLWLGLMAATGSLLLLLGVRGRRKLQ